jgi:hypothetical protein
MTAVDPALKGAVAVFVLEVRSSVWTGSANAMPIVEGKQNEKDSAKPSHLLEMARSLNVISKPRKSHYILRGCQQHGTILVTVMSFTEIYRSQRLRFPASVNDTANAGA